MPTSPRCATTPARRSPRCRPGWSPASLARREADAGPVSVLSCDNLPENGAVTAAVVTDLAELVRPRAGGVGRRERRLRHLDGRPDHSGHHRRGPGPGRRRAGLRGRRAGAHRAIRRVGRRRPVPRRATGMGAGRSAARRRRDPVRAAQAVAAERVPLAARVRGQHPRPRHDRRGDRRPDVPRVGRDVLGRGGPAPRAAGRRGSPTTAGRCSSGSPTPASGTSSRRSPRTGRSSSRCGSCPRCGRNGPRAGCRWAVRPHSRPGSCTCAGRARHGRIRARDRRRRLRARPMTRRPWPACSTPSPRGWATTGTWSPPSSHSWAPSPASVPPDTPQLLRTSAQPPSTSRTSARAATCCRAQPPVGDGRGPEAAGEGLAGASRTGAVQASAEPRPG